MIPGFVLLRMYKGQTFNDVITLKDDLDAPLDLTGRTARMQVRRDAGGPIILELTTANGRIAPLDTTGQIIFNVTAEDLAELPQPSWDYEEWVYDLELVTPGVVELVERPIFGVVVFFGEITV